MLGSSGSGWSGPSWAAIGTVEWLSSALSSCVAMCGCRVGDGVLSSLGCGSCCEGGCTEWFSNCRISSSLAGVGVIAASGGWLGMSGCVDSVIVRNGTYVRVPRKIVVLAVKASYVMSVGSCGSGDAAGGG